MSRRNDGFPIADIDTRLLGDTKVRKLVRSSADREDAATTLLLYISLLLESWSHGERVHFDDGAPPWWIGASDDERRQALQRAGLLDRSGRIPVRAWSSWFGPAHERRERARESGREGNRRRWQSDPDRDPIGSRSPTVPTVPTDRVARPRASRAVKKPDRAATATTNGDPRPLGEILKSIDPTFTPPTKETRRGKS